MKGVTTVDGKEICPMFPRLHVNDAEKGGPKAPPRNKMALYEQFSIPSQSFASGSAASLFPLPRRNCTVPSTPSHVGSSKSIQFCTPSAPSFLADRIQSYRSRSMNLTTVMQYNFINSNNSLKTFEGEDAFVTSGTANGKNSCCSIIENDNDDKLAHCNSSSSLKSLNSFSKRVNSPGAMELKSAQNGKNQMENHSEVSQTDQKTKEGSNHLSYGFGDKTDSSSLISLEKVRSPKSMKKEHISLKEESESISEDSLKRLKVSNAQTQEGHAAFRNKINLNFHSMEKLAVNDVHKYSDGLEISRRCFLSKRDRNRDEETYRHYDALNKSSSENILGMDISPDNVLAVLGEKQFWKARRTLINQQRIFLGQVFDLHRLIKVQRLIASSPHLLLEDSFLSNKPPLIPSAFKKLHSEYVNGKPSSIVKLANESEKPLIAEEAKNNAVEKIPLPCVNNRSKGQPSNYGNHSGKTLSAPSAINTKQSPYCVYPPPGNQWLVPVMSPSEGLVYKPIIGPSLPNAGLMAPVYSTCGVMSLNSGSKDVSDAALAPSSHQSSNNTNSINKSIFSLSEVGYMNQMTPLGSNQRIGIISGPPLPQLLPPYGPTIMHPSLSASGIEQMVQSNGPENKQSSSNVSSQMSQVMSRHVTTYQSFKDKELHRSTASSSSKRNKGDEPPLFPLAPTFWSSGDQKTHIGHNQPRVIKAQPHNAKLATESAARIYRSIQEERKFL